MFPRRSGHNVNAAFKQVILIHQHQVGLAPTKDFGEHHPEAVPDLLERVPEHLTGLNVDAVDDFEQLRLGLDQVVVLLAQELVALLGFLVFLDSDEVHRPHLVDALLQRLDLLGDGSPIRGGARGGHFIRRHYMHLRLALVGVGDGDALAANVVEVEMILLLDPLAQVLHGHVLLRQFDIEGSALFLQAGQTPALLAQAFLARGHVLVLGLLLRHQVRRLRIDLFAVMLEFLDQAARFLDLGLGPLLAANEGGQLAAPLLDHLRQLADSLVERLPLLLERGAHLLLRRQGHPAIGQPGVRCVPLLA